jgi:hypothetical protein
MKRFDARIIFGGALVLFGGLLLLERIGILHGASGLFWGVLFLVGAAYFFNMFLKNPRTQWWAIIPGMAMLGIGGGALLPEAFDAWGGALFLGSIGIAFWVVYLTDRSRWWGIIPGGVLLTLAAISVMDEVGGIETGGFFFLGLGLTFLLVALLPHRPDALSGNSIGKTQWAYIPAGILLTMGVLLGIGSTSGLMTYLWPAVLILSGAALLFFYFFKRE